MFRKMIGPYAVVRELGSGGMGSVYLVRRRRDRFALKVVHDRIASSPGMLERFHREVEAGRAVDHPNVVRTLDAGEHKGRHYLVMEYVEGRSLRGFLEALGRVPEALMREIAAQSAAGLQAIHAAGIIHRDIKPENILITDRNEIRVMDLGVAKLAEASVELTRAGQFTGSVLYAAPEQFKTSGVGPPSDLYALGVVLYELASGKNPFRADDLVTVIHNHLHLVPEPLDRVSDEVSGFLSAVVAQLLEKEAGARFGAASELHEVLANQERSAWWNLREAESLLLARPKIPVRRATALFGREAAMGELREAWSAAREGAGGVVVLRGEAGIGKTRLLDAFIEGIEPAEAHILYGAFRAGGGLGGVTQGLVGHFGASGIEPALTTLLAGAPAVVPSLAARLRNEVPPAGTPELAPEALHAILCRLAQAMAANKPVVWMVDDLHLAQREGRDALLSLARALADHRILLVISTRPGGLVVEGAHLIELTRLAADDLEALLADALGSEEIAARLAPRIAEKSDGVPLFALELLKGLEDSGLLRREEDGTAVATGPITVISAPESLRDLVEARLHELTDEDRDLLEAASVQGAEFDTGLLADTLDLKRVHVLRKLASIERRTGMVRAQGNRYHFDLKQAQEALGAALTGDLRREYHALLCEAYLARLDKEPDGRDAHYLTRHSLRGTRPKAALAWLEPALESLAGAYRLDEQIDLARAALDVDGLLDGAARCRVLLDLVKPLDILGLREEQGAALAEAATLADAAGDPGLSARVRMADAVLNIKTGRYADAERIFAEAAELAQAAGDRMLEARATGSLGTVLDNTGRHTDALVHLRDHLTIAEAEQDRPSEMIARCNLSLALFNLGRLDEAEAEMKRHLGIARELGDPRGEAIATGNLSMIAGGRGKIEDAVVLLRRNIELARGIGDRRSEAIASMNLGNWEIARGRLAAAGEILDRTLVLTREIDDPRVEAHVELNRASIRRQLGRLEEALVVVDRATGLFRATQDAESEEASKRKRASILFELGRGPKPAEDHDSSLAPLFAAAARGEEQAALDFDNEAVGNCSTWTRLTVLHALYRATANPKHIKGARALARTLIENAPEEHRDSAEAYYLDRLAD